METVQVILEAAARILEAEGFEGYTTNAIAARAGVSVGSLYQYFPGKDAITKALIARETAVLLADVAATVAAGLDGRAGLKRLIEAAVAHQLRRPELACLLDFAERHLPLEEDVAHVGQAMCDAISSFLAAPDLAGARRDASAPYDLMAMVRGMVDMAGERGDTDALQARVERAVFGYLGVN